MCCTAMSLHAPLSSLGPLPHTILILFFFNAPATTHIYTLSLHDALPISSRCRRSRSGCSRSTQARPRRGRRWSDLRSEEHTSELQSHHDLVCRLLLEKKKKK